jgi:tetratricopeptide (TPR) repeat protein
MGQNQKNGREGQGRMRRQASPGQMNASEKRKRFRELLRRGKEKFDANDFSGAVRETNKSLKLKPRHPEAYYLRSLARLRLRDDRGSTRDMERYVMLTNSNTISMSMKIGSRAIAMGDMETGLKSMGHAISRKCDAIAQGFIKRGRMMELAGDSLNAIRQFTQAVGASPWSTSPLMARGKAYMALNEFANAKKDFEKALEMGAFAEGFVYRGICLHCLGDSENAVLDITKAIGINPKCAEAFFHRAIVLDWMKMREAALSDINKALGLKPENADFLAIKGLILHNLGRYEDAIYILEAIPKQPKVLYRMAIAFESLGRPGDAIRCLGSAIQMDGNDHTFYLKRSGIRRSMGDMEGAERDGQVAAALKKQNDFDETMSRGFILLANGKYDAALACASNAVELMPSDPDAYALRASVHQAADRDEEAIADCGRAIELAPDDAELYNLRSMYYFNMEDYGNALEDIGTALSLAPRDVYFKRVRAQILIGMGRYEEAIAWLSRAIRRDPDSDSLHYDMAECLFSQGKIRASMREFRAAIKSNPHNPVYHSELGAALYKRGDYMKAIRLFSKSVQVAEKEGKKAVKSNSYTNIALCFENLGNNFEAMRNYNLAVEADQKNAVAFFNRSMLKKRIGDEEGARQDLEKSWDLESQEEDPEPPF